MGVRRKLASALSILFWSSPAFAYRPFDSTDADVASVRALEIELGPMYYLREDRQTFLVVPAIVLNLGLFEGCELVLEGRNEMGLHPPPDEPRFQVVGTALSLKGVLRDGSLQEHDGVSVATEVGALLPTTPEAGFGAVGTVIVSQRASFGTAHLNGGVALTRSRHGDAFGGLILEGPFDWSVRPVAEAFLEREIGVSSMYSALAGAIWRAVDALSFDAAIRRGRVSGVALTEVRAGLTWTFER